MDTQFWSGRKVFVTGHTGFKGSWLSQWLYQLGAEVTGYALTANTEPSLFEILNLKNKITSIEGNVCNLAALKNAVQSSQPEVVFHLAAQPLVRRSYQEPVETYETNLMGTVNILESVRVASNVRAFVNITTDKCYENKEWLWGYRETEPLGGYDPYSSSKACSELITAAYRSSFFNQSNSNVSHVGVATARAGNVIGGGDWAADRLIPDILSSFAKKDPVLIRNPNAVRPWQHVLEPLRGYLQLAELLYKKEASFSEAWNFGPLDGDSKAVEWIVENMAGLWGPEATWKLVGTPQPHEANNLKLDISKAINRLNWRPYLSLEESLKMIVEWEKARLEGKNMMDITSNQISNYQSNFKK